MELSLPFMYKDSLNDSPAHEPKTKASSLVLKSKMNVEQSSSSSSSSSSSHSSAITKVPVTVKLLVSVESSVRVISITDEPRAVGVPDR